jgi:hypothetical protein
MRERMTEWPLARVPKLFCLQESWHRNLFLANINDETWRQMARLWRKPEPSYLPE